MTIVKQQQTGFTLFELLVAMAIFGVVSYLAYSGMTHIFDMRDHTQIAQHRLADIQLTFLHFERDLEHAVKRPVRMGYGDWVGEVVGDELADYRLAITRGGRFTPRDIPRSNLQRVGYLIEDDILYRITWAVLDQAPDSEPRKTKILENVENLELRFLTKEGEWANSWDSASPPTGQAVSQEPRGLPRAVAVNITIKDFGAINRLFVLPEV